MNDDVVEFEFAYTPEELAAQRRQNRRVLGVLGAVALGMLGTGVYFLLDESYPAAVGTMAVPLLGGLWFSRFFWRTRRDGRTLTKSHSGPYRDASLSADRVRCRFDSTGLQVSSVVWECSARWEAVESASLDAEPMSVQWFDGSVRRLLRVPRRVLDEATRERLRALVDAARLRFRPGAAPTKSNAKRTLLLWLGLIVVFMGVYSFFAEPQPTARARVDNGARHYRR